MTATISQSEELKSFTRTYKKSPLTSRLITWMIEEDAEHHIAWVGVSIMAMAAVFFPATMFVVLLNGMPFVPMLMAMIALALVVVTNLAAMPTKYTIPFFALGILIDVLAVITSFYFK